jgi:hypothetical protein
LTLVAIMTYAQATITLQVPPFGVLLKSQLWNMLLVNTGSRSLSVRIDMVMLDQKTNQPVMTGTTMPFVLDRGPKQIREKDLQPIQYTYSGAAALADRDPNGMLPIGNYEVCYTLIALSETNVPLAQSCIQLAVDPLSPPLLNTPADESKIYTASPQFTWLPPTPVAMFGDLSYDLVLVEVLPGQGNADAIQQNIPVYTGGLIHSLYLNYASSFTDLDTGRLYAWRIVAMSNGQPAAMSDIWTFRVVTPPLPALPRKTNDPYLELKRDIDPTIAAGSATLRVTYDNAAADTVVHYTITSLNDAGNPVVQQGPLTLERGRNLLEVKLTQGGYARQKVYLFQLVNSRNETWNLKFTGPAK